MIVDVPTADDFYRAGLNQIHLAWGIAMENDREYREAISYGGIDEEMAAQYWELSKPALNNAYGLIQQGMELALKGRIASISPYILIGNPGDWPGRAAKDDVSFAEFRTIDAADLMKVHNCLVASPLGEGFRVFWDKVRTDRNKIIHSHSPSGFPPSVVIATILRAVKFLFNEMSWPRRLIEIESSGKMVALGTVDFVRNDILDKIEAAINQLQPAEALELLGFDKKRRSYLCPLCYSECDKDYQESWPHLAQLASKKKGENMLRCVVCENMIAVERENCPEEDCKGDVIFEGFCLTCNF